MFSHKGNLQSLRILVTWFGRPEMQGQTNSMTRFRLASVHQRICPNLA